jgi:inner membrane protein involved in colicin E2 resistance
VPVPAIFIVLGFVKARDETRVALLAGSLVLFVVIYVVSYMFFCVGCS